jgi:ABC-type glycerol-3-phosphate transport system substrate-binding protein
MSVFDGKQYRLGWYAVPKIWAYNKDQFDKAGLDADKPPTTHEELMAAAEKLKSKDITPIVGGLKDGYWGEWQMGHGLGPNLDSPAEALNLFAGSLDWREPKYWDHWGKVEQLWKAKFMNDDMLSLELYPGIDLFNAGKGAMCSMVGPLFPKSQKALGADKVWPMVYPAGGKGKMNGRPIADTQGLGISSQSKVKQAAAEFLTFLHGEERLKALYDQIKQMPADTSWNGDAALQDPGLKYIWKTWMQGSNTVPYISNLMPTLFWNEAMFVNSQKIVAGEFTGEKAAENAAAVAQKWRDQNPDLLEKYTKWANDLKL